MNKKDIKDLEVDEIALVAKGHEPVNQEARFTFFKAQSSEQSLREVDENRATNAVLSRVLKAIATAISPNSTTETSVEKAAMPGTLETQADAFDGNDEAVEGGMRSGPPQTMTGITTPLGNAAVNSGTSVEVESRNPQPVTVDTAYAQLKARMAEMSDLLGVLGSGALPTQANALSKGTPDETTTEPVEKGLPPFIKEKIDEKKDKDSEDDKSEDDDPPMKPKKSDTKKASKPLKVADNNAAKDDDEDDDSEDGSDDDDDGDGGDDVSKAKAGAAVATAAKGHAVNMTKEATKFVSILQRTLSDQNLTAEDVAAAACVAKAQTEQTSIADVIAKAVSEAITPLVERLATLEKSVDVRVQTVMADAITKAESIAFEASRQNNIPPMITRKPEGKTPDVSGMSMQEAIHTLAAVKNPLAVK